MPLRAKKERNHLSCLDQVDVICLVVGLLDESPLGELSPRETAAHE